MKRCIRFLASFIGSIVALLMAHYFNFIIFLTFVPDDKKYDVCIAVYFTCIEAIIGIIFDFICEWFESRRTYIEVVFYNPKETVNISATPIVKFNNMGMAELMLRVKVKGKSANIKNGSIRIEAFKQADMQFAKKGLGAKISNNGDALIKLMDICDGHEELDYEEDFKLVFQRGDYDTYSSRNIKPELVSVKSPYVKYERNYMEIILEER